MAKSMSGQQAMKDWVEAMDGWLSTDKALMVVEAEIKGISCIGADEFSREDSRELMDACRQFFMAIHRLASSHHLG